MPALAGWNRAGGDMVVSCLFMDAQGHEHALEPDALDSRRYNLKSLIRACRNRNCNQRRED